MKKQPKEIVVCLLECLVMPNGEVVSNGKVIGLFKDFAKFLIIKKK